MAEKGRTATRKAAVIGHPVSHSKSPQLHAAAYRLLGFDCCYTAVDVGPGELESFIRQFREDAHWHGLSVTMPHKAEALTLVDELTPGAAALGVLNTITVSGRRADGVRRLTGHNTDVAGIAGALRHAGAGKPEPGGSLEPAVVLGGGGTAAAALAGLAELGVRAADVYVRSPERAAPLRGIGNRLGCETRLHSWDGAVAAVARASVVVSTLPPHGADQLAGELPDRLDGGASPVLLDVAYDPWPSALAAVWHSSGGTVVPGLEMLIYQAVEQVRLFTAELPGGAFDEAGVINAMCDVVGAPPR